MIKYSIALATLLSRIKGLDEQMQRSILAVVFSGDDSLHTQKNADFAARSVGLDPDVLVSQLNRAQREGLVERVRWDSATRIIQVWLVEPEK